MQHLTRALALLLAAGLLLAGCTAQTPARRQRDLEFCKNPVGTRVDNWANSLRNLPGDPLLSGTSFVGRLITGPIVTTAAPFVGTTKCKDGKPRRMAVFVHFTHERLLADVARGEGESLAALEQLLALTPAQAERFRGALRAELPRLVGGNPWGFADSAFAAAVRIKDQGPYVAGG